MTVTDTHSHQHVIHFFGLSTDTKPDSVIGSTFTETDTQKEFVYDGANWTRGKTVVVQQLAAVAAKELLLAKATDALLAEILTELKIQNAHLAMVTGEELDDTDTEA